MNSRTFLALVISAIIVISLVVTVIVLHGLVRTSAPASPVTVTAIEFASRDNVCGSNGRGASGYTSTTMNSYAETYWMTNTNHYTCVVNAVTALTSGFVVASANIPLSINPGGTEALLFTITSPHEVYTGTLAIDLE